jgi:hypothetical protein
VKVAPWRTSAINGNLNGKNTSLSLYAYIYMYIQMVFESLNRGNIMKIMATYQ